MGKPLGYRKPNPKKPKNYRLSFEEEFAVNTLLKKMRTANKNRIPSIENMDLICSKPEVSLLPKKIYSGYGMRRVNELPRFPIGNIIRETKISYIAEFSDIDHPKRVKINKKTLKGLCWNGRDNIERDFFGSYEAAFKDYLKSTESVVSAKLYSLDFETFDCIIEAFLHYDKMPVLEYIFRLEQAGFIIF